MSLKTVIMEQLKVAMRNKDKVALESLRAIKSELLLIETSSDKAGEVSEDLELKVLQKLVKQRKDSAETYQEQGRNDLAEPELAQAAVIARFLPKQMTQDEIEKVIKEIVAKVDAKSMADMGKVMGMANKELAGKADGKTIATIVKQQLT